MFESKSDNKQLDSKKEKEVLKELERLRKKEEDNALKELERLKKEKQREDELKKYMEKFSRRASGLELQQVELDYLHKKEQEKSKKAKSAELNYSKSDKSKSDSKQGMFASMKNLKLGSSSSSKSMKPNKLVRKSTMNLKSKK